MKIVETVAEVREQVKAWRKEGLTVGLVPTMGYLHEGHQSLIAKACAQNDRVVVSIFVNPTQFGPNEDLARERASNVQYWLGEKTGHQLWQYARGIDDSPVKAVPDEAKGFSVETTFNDDITSIEQVFPILLEQCDVLATRMRRKDKKCNCISVTFRTLDFRNRSHQTKLENATDLTDEIYINATRLFKEFWKGQPLRLIGVALTGLTDGTYEQMSLFEDTENKERHRKLDAAMDEIRMKFGNDKITRASIMNSNARIGRKAKAQMKNEKMEEP